MKTFVSRSSQIDRVQAGCGAWHGAARLGIMVLMLLALGVRAGAEERGGTSRVDLNTASADDLAALPGIGPAKAKAIIAQREIAPFTSVEELRDVKGIGDHLFEQLKDRVSVSAAGGRPSAAMKAATRGAPNGGGEKAGKSGSGAAHGASTGS